MLERLIHEPVARETGQPLLTLSSLIKQLDLILILINIIIINWFGLVSNIK